MALRFPSNSYNDASWFANVPLFDSVPKVTLDTNKSKQIKSATQLFLLISLEQNIISLVLFFTDLIGRKKICCHFEGNCFDVDIFVCRCVYVPEKTTNYSSSLSLFILFCKTSQL